MLLIMSILILEQLQALSRWRRFSLHCFVAIVVSPYQAQMGWLCNEPADVWLYIEVPTLRMWLHAAVWLQVRSQSGQSSQPELHALAGQQLISLYKMYAPDKLSLVEGLLSMQSRHAFWHASVQVRKSFYRATRRPIPSCDSIIGYFR